MIKNSIANFIALTVVSAVVFTACKKDDDNNVPDRAKKIMHTWKITDITTPKVNQPATDSTIYKPCMADDLIKFSNTGFDFEDGATKCDSSIFHYAKGSWGYNAADSIQLLSTVPTAGKYTSWKIVTLNDSILQVKYTDSANPAKKMSKTISFKH